MRILIADDHPIVRRGIKDVILDECSCAEFGEAANGEELLAKARQGDWDVVLCDLNMPGRGGLEALKQLKLMLPKLPVLIMSMYPPDQYAVRAIKAGASGYLSKNSIHVELIPAVQTVTMGRKYITPAIGEELALSVHRPTNIPSHHVLSDRELEVFKLLAAGKTVSDIADELSLSPNTVSTYRSRILDKMNMHSNGDLIRYAIEKQLV
jgi:two-component system, NarL family, invasion response regulator UvrY